MKTKPNLTMKEKNNEIETLDFRFLHGKEESVIQGIPESDIEIWKDKLLKRDNHKKIRFVSDWIWWEINCMESTRKMLSQDGLKPTALYSHNLLWDELGDFAIGSSVKTSLLERFEEECLFITRNTTYVLVGPGRQSDIDPRVFNSIHF
jgi:hypothetical protein